VLQHGSSTLLADSLTTKAGGVFCLCAPSGDIDAGANGSQDLYFHDTPLGFAKTGTQPR
jgi:hypothetical protein